MQNLEDAFQRFTAGDVTGAEAIVRAVLAEYSDNVSALNLLAGILRAQGDRAGALAAFDRAVALAPDGAPLLFNRANLLLEMQRAEEALVAFDAVLARRSGHAETHLNRARALVLFGRHAEAIADFQRASDLGLETFALHHLWALSLAAIEQPQAALHHFDAALAFAPNDSASLFNLARCLHALDRLEEALVAYDRAVYESPSAAETWNNRGALLFDLDRLDEALASNDRALELGAESNKTWSNRGLTLFALKRPAEAIAAFDRALALSPEDPQLHYNRAMASLTTHDLRAGWAGFEARWDAGMVRSARRENGEPRWHGEKLAGALRIWLEQGIGDEILFARFALLARERTAPVILQCDPRLAPLLQRSFPGLDVRSLDAPVAPATAQIAGGSLGACLHAGVESLNSGAPYIIADSAKRDALRAKYETAARGRPIIGIAWSSNAPKLGAAKSAPLHAWGPLLRREALFVNLQYGDVAAEIAEVRASLGCEIIEDGGVDQLKDLDAFAAQIAAMDRIVSVSNTTAHFAGAVGARCIVLVAPARGRLWYWGLEGERTPWYASLRLVRRDLTGTREQQIARAAALL